MITHSAGHISKLQPGDKIGLHFSSSEFDCHDRQRTPYPAKYYETLLRLVMILEQVRNRFGIVRITSAYRTVAHNSAIGGASRSWHVKGRAVDFTTSDRGKLLDAHAFLVGAL